MEKVEPWIGPRHTVKIALPVGKRNCDNYRQGQETMAIEQLNISLSPRMARFIRGKVKNGEYTNMSEVVKDAVRRMQEHEAVKSMGTGFTDYESSLTKGQREGIRRGVRQGSKDIDEGRYEEYNADGLRKLAKDLVAVSAKKSAGRSTGK